MKRMLFLLKSTNLQTPVAAMLKRNVHRAAKKSVNRVWLFSFSLLLFCNTWTPTAAQTSASTIRLHSMPADHHSLPDEGAIILLNSDAFLGEKMQWQIPKGDEFAIHAQTAVCGDFIVDPSEGCDDGNTASGDGCSGTCNVEPGYACPGGNTCFHVIYVKADAVGANNGTSWANAYTDLQTAINASYLGWIWVAKGTYYPTTGTDRSATFSLKNNVAIYGGFNGTETMLSQRNVTANVTILSGDIDKNNTLDNGNSYHVVTGSGTNNTALLDGFTITAGNANGSFPNEDGGGMFNETGSPTVTNCTFFGNNADNVGGGMLNSNNSSPTIIYCTFLGNTADRAGGGMFNTDSSSPTLTNCNFSGNTVVDFGSGGGMFNTDSSSPTLTNCNFSGNTVGDFGSGGGMYNADNSPTLNNCTFSGNSANNGNGGGMYNIRSLPILNNCTFSGNSAESGGGGGMINNEDSSPILTNCTFSGNSAELGGGIVNGFNCSPILTNCIIWNNRENGSTTTTTASIFNSGSNPTISYSLIANSGGSGGSWQSALGTDGGNNKDVDPLFVTPIDFTMTPPPTTAGNLRLLPTSPAINMGNNAAVPADTKDVDDDGNVMEPTPDLDLNDRIVGASVDMGAFEFPCITPAGTISSNVNAICAGESVELTFTATVGAGPFDIVVNGTAYNDVVSGSVFATLTEGTAFTGTSDFTLTAITDNNGCLATGLSQKITVTVNPLPTASISQTNSPICSGQNAEFVLSGTPNAEVTYTINGGGSQTVNLDANGEATVTVNNATANQTLNLVSVKNTSTNCSQNLNGSATVIVNQPATVEAGNAQTICQTKTVNLLTIGASIGGGASAGVWSTSGDGTFTGGTAFGSATAYVPGTNDKKLGAVILTLTTTDAGVCPNVADQVQIKILKVDCGAFPWNGN